MYIISSFISEQLAAVGVLITLLLWFIFLAALIYFFTGIFLNNHKIRIILGIIISILILLLFILFVL